MDTTNLPIRFPASAFLWFLFLGLVWLGASASAADLASSADSRNGVQEGFLDKDAELPELQAFFQSGPNDIRDILVVQDGFFVATGTAIIRYRYSGDAPVADAVFTERDGLPSGNCYRLKCDADGGIWAHCQAGVGYLPAKCSRWKTFTSQNGLALGNATDLALSSNGNRIWVVGTGGLATALVRELRWQAFPAKNLIDVLVHPDAETVWCRNQMLSRCMCGRHIATLQFDLAGQTWREVPESGNCPHVAPIPSYFNIKAGLLWFSAGEPPKAYDPKTNKTRSWPKEPNWERISNSSSVEFSDGFGDMSPERGEGGGVWFATNAGLWRYDPQKDRWTGHVRNAKPGCGQPLLVSSIDGNTLYWSCEGTVAAFHVPTGKWADLWHVDDAAYHSGKQSLTLSPDGKAVWLIGVGGIIVGQPASRTATLLDDTDQLGLSGAKFVRFDSRKQVALIGTSRGVVCTDYNGAAKFMLRRSAPPIYHEVTRFVFAPDGSEVWCEMRSGRGHKMPAARLLVRKDYWEEVPAPRTDANFHDVVFSRDGSTEWLSRSNHHDDLPNVLQKRPGDSPWEPLRADMPTYYDVVEQFWQTPQGDELWLGTSGKGLFRIKLASGKVDHLKGFTLGGDYVYDVVFTPNGKRALCSVGGGGKEALISIELESGNVTHYPAENFWGAKLVASPDNRIVWCHVNGRLLSAFDVQNRDWTHRYSSDNGMPLSCFRAIQCSPDGKFLWLRGWEGVAVYCIANKSWKAFIGDPWQTFPDDPPPLCITSDGKHVLCGHRRGLAVIAVDGSTHELLTLGDDVKNSDVTSLVALPGSDDYVCSITHPHVGGIYIVDMKRRKLRKVKDLKDSVVSAMAIGPDGYLWGAIPGSVFCLNPASAEERADLKSLHFGKPSTEPIQPKPPRAEPRVVIAPAPAARGRVSPRPKLMPARPSPVKLNTEGMVRESTHLPVIATSDRGKTYVSWFAHPATYVATETDLPLIPEDLLPDAGVSDGATGISVHDGKRWHTPQLILEGRQACNIRFAWCQKEDWHVLVQTSERGRLYHLVYQPATRRWKKLHVLWHSAWDCCACNGTVHLADFDDNGHRVYYRTYDGDKWSQLVTLETRGDFDGLAMAVEDDGTGHVVWKDGEAQVAHAIIRSGNAECFRQTFPERIVSREFAITSTADHSVIMGYQPELYEGHADQHMPYIRIWSGKQWSPPTLIPFDRVGFDSPAAIGYGRSLLLSWVADYGGPRVYSVLGQDGMWSYPLPICKLDDKRQRCDHFVRLHVDSQGVVRAAWHSATETFCSEVTRLDY